MTVAWSWMTDFIFPRVMRQVLVTTEKDRVEVEKHRSRKAKKQEKQNAEKQRSRKAEQEKQRSNVSREAEKQKSRKSKKQESIEPGTQKRVQNLPRKKSPKINSPPILILG